jgi:magnesium-dependent phosphatase-1
MAVLGRHARHRPHQGSRRRLEGQGPIWRGLRLLRRCWGCIRSSEVKSWRKSWQSANTTQLKAKSILIGAASRTHAPDLGREMLKLLKVPNASVSSGRAIDYFDHMQIYPGSKTTHFTKIHRDSGIEYNEMLFFDDESRNKNVEVLGVTMWLVKDGVTRDEIDAGVRSWRARTGRTKA